MKRKVLFVGALFLALGVTMLLSQQRQRAFFADAPGIPLRSAPTGIVWDVYPTMGLTQIQGVVDIAADGDTIYFHAGTYDWSGAPLHPRYANEGAINIVDKTLTIMGEPGNLLKGPDWFKDSGGTVWGTQAFHVLDRDLDHDATFVGLNIQHFMWGITDFHVIVVVPNINEYSVPNGRNLTIKNCSISDTTRGAILINDPTGDIKIQNNHLSQAHYGVWLTYRGPDLLFWQPDQSSVMISGNEVTSFNFGILAERTKNFRVENNTFDAYPSTNWPEGIWIHGTKEGTVISSNLISNCVYGIEIYGSSGTAYDAGSDQVVVERNRVSPVPLSSYPNSWCYGILFDGNLLSGQKAIKNEIKLASVNGIGIYSEAHHGYYALNKVSGTGGFAVGLFSVGYSALPAFPNNEIFQANNVGKFIPSEAHFYLDDGSYDNIIFGSGIDPVTYIDNGTNNRITGMTPMRGGIGRSLKELRSQVLASITDPRKSLF
jgi:parallel beta-helix repeat protein